MFIATGGRSGYLPGAPGTWGSLVGVCCWLVLRWLPTPWYWTAIAILFLIGIFAAGAAEKIVDQGDPSLVVVDEIVGQLITLAGTPLHPPLIGAGFILFRIFDISKPFPVNWLDGHLHGGAGIMLDDVAAGLFGLLAMTCIRLLFF